MKQIGIIETGLPPEALRDRYPSYPAMIEALLGPGFGYRTFAVTEGLWPATPDACDAYVITGSSAGVYDDLPWIAPLKDFLHAARGRARLVGICFGHQIMAEAFGGVVRKSEKGWGLGLHRYAIQGSAPWMADDRAVSVAVSHQDQVVVAPADATVLGGNDFTPNGILAYGDDAISFQCHPEFEPAFAAALVELRRDRLPDLAQADVLMASLDAPNDRNRVGEWIRRYITLPE